MKLHEMGTKQMAKVLSAIAEPIANLVGDVDLMQGIASTLKSYDGEMVGQKMAAIIRATVPQLLDKHFTDVCAIVAAMTEKTMQQVENQPFMETVKDIKESLDADLIGFFQRSALQEKTES